MDYKDYYKIMEVQPDASAQDIKLAYRRLARKYHPDISKHENAEEKFKELGAAYEVLKDPAKRKEYDELRRYQEASKHGNSQREWRTGWSSEANTESIDPNDLFASLFGHGRFRDVEQPGSDLHAQMPITLEEAYHGCVKELHLQGSGTPQTIRVKIPAGVSAGQQIRLEGQGSAPMGRGERGDLYLTIQIAKHPLFDVIERDIYLTLPVTPWEVALGSTISVPTLAGNVQLKIPPGSQGGQKLRLKHRGLPGKTAGDQYVMLKIITPKPTSEKAKELYQKMAVEMPFNPREHMGGSS